MAEQFTIPEPGDTVAGKYLIEEELGRGSYGVVFRAKQLGINRDVALKTLLPQAFLHTEIVSRFQREASVISRLHHPKIVTLYDFGQADGVLYMAMEFVRGRPLNVVMRQEAPFAEERALNIILQVLVALTAAHAEGIVHRDLKPENIIICEDDDGNELVKVLDFGIAKLTHGEEQQDALKTLTIEGYVLGTPHYMSPEIISGDPVTQRADLYAVGILLYELLVGQHPFEAPNPSSVLIRHLSDPVPPLPNPAQESGRFGYAIRRSLEKEPDDRVADAETFIQILDGTIAPPRRRHSATLPVIIATIGLVLTLLALGAGALVLYLAGGDSHSPQATTQGTAPPEKLDEPVTPPREDGQFLARSAAAVAACATRLDSARTTAGRSANTQRITRERPANKARPVDKPSAKRETPKRVEKPTTTQLRLVSTPPGARATVNGKAAGTTPCSYTVAAGEPATVSFQKIGFRTAIKKIAPKAGARTVSVTLQPGRIKLAP